MNFDISLVCNCNSFLCYSLNKLVPSLHFVNSVSLCMQHFFFVGSFLSFDKKNTDNDVVTTSLPPALSFYWVCDLLCSHLDELLLNKEVAAGENKKQSGNSASWLQLRTCHFQNCIFRGSVILFFEKEQDHQKRECGIMQNLLCTWIFLGVTRCPWPKVHF